MGAHTGLALFDSGQTKGSGRPTGPRPKMAMRIGFRTAEGPGRRRVVLPASSFQRGLTALDDALDTRGRRRVRPEPSIWAAGAEV